MQEKTFDEMAAAYLPDYSNPRHRKEIFLDMLKEAGVTKYVKKLRKKEHVRLDMQFTLREMYVIYRRLGWIPAT